MSNAFDFTSIEYERAQKIKDLLWSVRVRFNYRQPPIELTNVFLREAANACQKLVEEKLLIGGGKIKKQGAIFTRQKEADHAVDMSVEFENETEEAMFIFYVDNIKL